MIGNGKVFVSHDHADAALCKPLLAALDRWGVDYWFDAEGLDAGHDLSRQIQQAIRERDIFIRICTPSSSTSYWVQLETGAFRGLQARDSRIGQPGKRLLINLVMDLAYQPEPFDYVHVFIDAAGTVGTAWLAQLGKALELPELEREQYYEILDDEYSDEDDLEDVEGMSALIRGLLGGGMQLTDVDRPSQGPCGHPGCALDADIRCDVCNAARCPDHSWNIWVTNRSFASTPRGNGTRILCADHRQMYMNFIHQPRPADAVGPPEFLTITHRATGGALVENARLWQG